MHSNTDPGQSVKVSNSYKSFPLHKANLRVSTQAELIIIYFLQLGYLKSSNQAIQSKSKPESTSEVNNYYFLRLGYLKSLNQAI
jgi:hypothetical protein